MTPATLALFPLAALAHLADPPRQASPDDVVAIRPVMTLGDFDGDGWLDVYAVYEEGEDKLWRNVGDGTFEDATERAGLAGNAGSLGAAWIDFDADLRLDLYVIASRTERRLFRNVEGQTFEDATASAGLAGVADEIAARWVDFDDDGYEDLFVRTRSGDLLFHNNGRGQLESIDLGVVERALALAPFASSDADSIGSRDGAPPRRPFAPLPPVGAGGGSNSRAGSSASAGASAGSGALLPGGIAAAQPVIQCEPSLLDQAGGPCIRASSVPALGKLYPLSSNLFVDAATGNVGIGTTSPGNRLTVAGTAEIGTRLGIGTDAPAEELHVRSTDIPEVFIDGNQPTVRFRHGNTNIGRIFGVPFGLTLSTETNVPIRFDIGGGFPVSFVPAAGGARVGIGAVFPAERLHLECFSDPRILVDSLDGTSTGLLLRQAGVPRGSLIANVGNTYLDSGPGNALHMRAEGTAGLVVAPGGSVGIGTTAPAATLDVAAPSNAALRVASNSGDAYLWLGGPTGVGFIRPIWESTGDLSIYSITADGLGGQVYVAGPQNDIRGTGYGSVEIAAWGTPSLTGDVFLSTQGQVRMMVDQDGRVGVGTTTPVSTLSVAGSADVTSSLGVGTTAPMRPFHVRSDDDLARFEGTSGYLDVVNTAPSGLMLSTDGTGPLSIRTAGGSGSGQMFLDTAGRLGIGTDTPSSTLSVNGNANVSTSLGVGASVGIGTSAPTAPLDIVASTAWTTWNKAIELADGSALKWHGSGAGWRHGIVQGANGLEIIRAQVDDGSAAHAKSVVVGNDGWVGIGVSGSPSAKLHVSDGGPASVFGLGQMAITGAGVQALSINTVGSGSCGVFLHNNGANAWRVSADRTSDDFVIANDSAGVPWAGPALVTVKDNGDVGIGTSSPQAKLDVDGTTRTQCVTITGGCDIVEGFETGGEVCEPGTVLVIDARRPGELAESSEPYDKRVAGVVSGAGGVRPGLALAQEGTLDGETKVAMAGRVYVKCTAENGAIEPGDRLTTSSLAGHAMRATDSTRCDGAVLGKAMSPLADGTGLVLVLVNLQ